MKDLTGLIFGKLRVISRDNTKSSRTYSYWLCQCECGLELSIRKDCLTNRGQDSCGCKYLNFSTGDKIGLLTIIKNLGPKGKYNYWECKCDCGNIKIVNTNGLSYKHTKSCGCLLKNFTRSGVKISNCLVKNWFFTRIKNSAESRNLEFNITQEYISNLILEQNYKCALSGIEINLPKNSRNSGTASLDRIDSSKGYIQGNVQWVHKDINIMKNNYSEEEFINWCKLVVNHKC